MALRSTGRKLSFHILDEEEPEQQDDDDDEGEEEGFHFHRSNSDPIHGHREQPTAVSSSVSALASPEKNKPNRKKRKPKASKKKKHHQIHSSIPEDPIPQDQSKDPNHYPRSREQFSHSHANGFHLNFRDYSSVGTLVCQEESSSPASAVTHSTKTDFHNLRSGEGFNFGELRQRSVNGGGGDDSAASGVDDNVKENTSSEINSVEKQRSETNESVIPRLETAESLDLNSLMTEDPNYFFSRNISPVKYFWEEMCNGNSLRSTTTVGSEKERERVYDTIFRLPWRCELLIDVGFFVCLDSFLSILTIMPTRILMTIWRLLRTRKFKMPSGTELSDFCCFIVMAFGVTLLQRTDISLIYHMIRGQGTIKLYVVYNVLEIFDKLCQSFVGDVLQTLFRTAEGLASSPPENMRFWFRRFVCDQALAVATSILHSFILLAQAITLSTCIVAHNNALLALLVSNNFAEIKSNVFKRFSKDNIHSLVYFDSVERFHISAFILFVLAQNILEAEGPWFESFLLNTLLVYICEMVIDIIKHSFIAKFNDIKPIAYSEFLEDLCRQTLNIQEKGAKKNLTFVPLAPACVVIRVLTPVYAAQLPCNSLLGRLFWIILFLAMTYVMLSSLKVLIVMGLKKHASWYVSRCQRRRHHLHAD